MLGNVDLGLADRFLCGQLRGLSTICRSLPSFRITILYYAQRNQHSPWRLPGLPRASDSLWLYRLASILFSSVFLQILSGGGIGTFRFVSVLDWFSISVPNSNWVADGVYGISMEFCRWVLVAFWSLLLVAALLWKYSAAKEHRLRFIAGLAGLLAIACGVRFAFPSN